jgi:CelD/BcsL family acetyltransferase involved in cellulose biosynthesis
MLSTKRSGLARRGLGGDWFESEAYAEFVAASLDRFGADGGRRIFALKAGGRLVAAALCNVDPAKVEAFVTTYDPACAAWSPGKLLLADIVRWAFARGLAVDLRAGHEPYKARWANRTGQVSFYVLPLTRRGAILARMDAARRWARRSLPPGLRASMARLRGPPG